MLLLTCPWCGARDETEYSYGGEAHIIRPPRPAELSDDQWADYLFMRSNPKGTHHERWVHSQGCRRWFNWPIESHTNKRGTLVSGVQPCTMPMGSPPCRA